LELSIEELNLLDAEDFARAERDFAAAGSADARLVAMLCAVAEEMPPDVAGLYGWLLNRTEANHGAALARTFARVVALSPDGLAGVRPRGAGATAHRGAVGPAELAALRRGFRAHLVQRAASGNGISPTRSCARRWLRGCRRATFRTRRYTRRSRRICANLSPSDPLRETERMST